MNETSMCAVRHIAQPALRQVNHRSRRVTTRYSEGHRLEAAPYRSLERGRKPICDARSQNGRDAAARGVRDAVTYRWIHRRYDVRSSGDDAGVFILNG